MHHNGHDEDNGVSSIDSILEHHLLVFHFKGLRVRGERVRVYADPTEVDRIEDGPGKGVSTLLARALQDIK